MDRDTINHISTNFEAENRLISTQQSVVALLFWLFKIYLKIITFTYFIVA